MHRQSLTAYGAPLCETVVEAPRPQGSEVLVRIERCGVCHSDLHMQDGFFALGDGKQLDVRAGRTLPFTLGHEIAGAVEAVGPDSDAKIGAKAAVYPWIGCGQCPACQHGDENICARPRHLGITVDGGYATHVLVPHARYLIDYAPLPTSYAGALMCSGLTAYAALKRLTDRASRAPLLLVGAGGVGLMGLALTCAMYGAPYVADIDQKKCEAALAAGAKQVFDPADPNTRKAVDVAEALASDQDVAEVEQEARSAKEAGIEGVPMFIFGGRFAVSGAQAPEYLAEAIERLAPGRDAAE